MKKKHICFPFVNGSLLNWTGAWLTDEEEEAVYSGKEVITPSYYGGKNEIVWRPNEEVELHLRYLGYDRGRSAFHWEDDKGHRYPMFIKNFDQVMQLGINSQDFHAIFKYVKRGANYGIQFVRMIEPS